MARSKPRKKFPASMLDYYPEPTMVDGVRTYELYPKDLSPIDSDPELASLAEVEPAPFELIDLPNGEVKSVVNPEYAPWKIRKIREGFKPKPKRVLKPIRKKRATASQSAPKRLKPILKTRVAEPQKKLSLYEQMCLNTGRDVAAKAPKKWKALQGDLGRKNHGTLTKLLSNDQVDITTRKVIAWCQEIGWSHAQPLLFIHLAGVEGVREIHLNTLLGYDYNYRVLLEKDLIWKEKFGKDFLLFSNVEKLAPPESVDIQIFPDLEFKNSLDPSRTRAYSRPRAVNERAHGGVSGDINILSKIIDPNKNNIEDREKELLFSKSNPTFLDSLNARMGLWPTEANPVLEKEEAKRKKKRAKKKLRAAPKISEPTARSAGAARQDPRRVFHEAKKKKRRKATPGRTGWKKQPSLNPRLSNWRMKKNPNRWNQLDWTGYWLHLWKKCYGEEDPLLVGQKLAPSMKKAKHGRGWKCQYYRLGFLLTGVRDSDQCFCGDGQKLKEYLEWLLGDFAEEAEWMKDPITYKQATKKTDNFFMNKFKTKAIKKKRKSNQQEWSPWGYED